MVSVKVQRPKGVVYKPKKENIDKLKMFLNKIKQDGK
jgi:hypothetical protein